MVVNKLNITKAGIKKGKFLLAEVKKRKPKGKAETLITDGERVTPYPTMAVQGKTAKSNQFLFVASILLGRK